MAVWKRRDTGKWVCDFRYNGRRHLQTLTLACTKKDAKEAEAVIMADVFRQVYGLNGKEDSPFDRFVLDKFLPYSEANKRTFYDDVLVCKVLIGYFKDKMMRSITSALVEEFKQKRLATPLSRQKDRVAKHWNSINTTQESTTEAFGEVRRTTETTQAGDRQSRDVRFIENLLVGCRCGITRRQPMSPSEEAENGEPAGAVSD